MKSHSEGNHSASQCVVKYVCYGNAVTIQFEMISWQTLYLFFTVYSPKNILIISFCGNLIRCTTLMFVVFFLLIIGFECRCGGLFCAVHRYSDKHDCSFNYRELGAEEIRRNNPVVVGEKIQKIWTPPLLCHSSAEWLDTISVGENNVKD